jgi:hypothetical protein
MHPFRTVDDCLCHVLKQLEGTGPDPLSELPPRPAAHVSRYGGDSAPGTPQGVERSAQHVWALHCKAS